MSQDERVIGVIPGAKIKTGLFSSKTYTLVVTDRRLILAEMTSAALKICVEAARAAEKTVFGRDLSQWQAQLAALPEHFANRYLAMSPYVILAETPGNGALAPADVRGIKVEHKTDRRDDDATRRDYLRITIETADGKREFNTDGEHPRADPARGMFAATFGPLVR